MPNVINNSAPNTQGLTIMASPTVLDDRDQQMLDKSRSFFNFICKISERLKTKPEVCENLSQLIEGVISPQECLDRLRVLLNFNDASRATFSNFIMNILPVLRRCILSDSFDSTLLPLRPCDKAKVQYSMQNTSASHVTTSSSESPASSGSSSLAPTPPPPTGTIPVITSVQSVPMQQQRFVRPMTGVGMVPAVSVSLRPAIAPANATFRHIQPRPVAPTGIAQGPLISAATTTSTTSFNGTGGMVVLNGGVALASLHPSSTQYPAQTPLPSSVNSTTATIRPTNVQQPIPFSAPVSTPSSVSPANHTFITTVPMVNGVVPSAAPSIPQSPNPSVVLMPPSATGPLPTIMQPSTVISSTTSQPPSAPTNDSLSMPPPAKRLHTQSTTGSESFSTISPTKSASNTSATSQPLYVPPHHQQLCQVVRSRIEPLLLSRRQSHGAGAASSASSSCPVARVATISEDAIAVLTAAAEGFLRDLYSAMAVEARGRNARRTSVDKRLTTIADNSEPQGNFLSTLELEQREQENWRRAVQSKSRDMEPDTQHQLTQPARQEYETTHGFVGGRQTKSRVLETPPLSVEESSLALLHNLAGHLPNGVKVLDENPSVVPHSVRNRPLYTGWSAAVAPRFPLVNGTASPQEQQQQSYQLHLEDLVRLVRRHPLLSGTSALQRILSKQFAICKSNNTKSMDLHQ